jgi:hypothetical protein
MLMFAITSVNVSQSNRYTGPHAEVLSAISVETQTLALFSFTRLCSVVRQAEGSRELSALY